MVQALHDWTLPLLQRGRHMNPVHHTAVVVDLMAAILLPEVAAGRLPREAMRMGLAAAVLHDSGNAFEPPDEVKITTEAARVDPALAEVALKQRQRHMQNGALLTEAALRDEGVAPLFSDEQIAEVRRLVQCHDAPTLVGLLGGSETKRDCMFASGDSPPHVAPPAAILREADRLWMLTVEGIVTDLIRKIAGAKPWDPMGQLESNAERHREERAQYDALYSAAQLGDWGMEPDTAFYRTQTGKRLFLSLQAEARALPLDEWVRRVLAVWSMIP